MKIVGFLASISLVLCSVAHAASPQGEPGWRHGVVLFGDEREAKDATPILQREYRPLHFYGNTVRREYYRGSVRPTVGDVYQMVRVTITRQ